MRNSPSYLEKVAREEYGYAYDGEKVYLLPEGEPAADRPETAEEVGEDDFSPP